MAKILIIDDEPQLRALLARIIGLEGYDVEQAPDCTTGLRLLSQYEPDVVLCDVKLPDGNGVELVGRIKEIAPAAEVILLTAYGNIPDGVQAIKNGAFDYITKGDDNNKILPLLSRATEKARMQRRLARFEAKLSDEHSFDRIIGSSEALRQAVNLARKVAATDTSVLLTGETGTGKEVFAQAIHQAGPRARETFVAVNCSAFSKELLESELFGHRAGSFTGATKDKKGLFEEADKGTLFLDEIGEMPVELQAKLLRVLESGEFIKIGETRRGIRPLLRRAVRRQDGKTHRNHRRRIHRRAGTPYMARQRARTAQRRRTEPDYGRRRTALRRYAVARIPRRRRRTSRFAGTRRARTASYSESPRIRQRQQNRSRPPAGHRHRDTLPQVGKLRRQVDTHRFIPRRASYHFDRTPFFFGASRKSVNAYSKAD